MKIFSLYISFHLLHLVKYLRPIQLIFVMGEVRKQKLFWNVLPPFLFQRTIDVWPMYIIYFEDGWLLHVIKKWSMSCLWSCLDWWLKVLIWYELPSIASVPIPPWLVRAHDAAHKYKWAEGDGADSRHSWSSANKYPGPVNNVIHSLRAVL